MRTKRYTIKNFEDREAVKPLPGAIKRVIGTEAIGAKAAITRRAKRNITLPKFSFMDDK